MRVRRSENGISLLGPLAADDRLQAVQPREVLLRTVNVPVAGSHVEASRYVATPSRSHTGGLSMKPLMNWMHPWWRRDAVNALSSLGKQRSSDLSGSDQATKTKSVRFWESTLVEDRR